MIFFDGGGACVFSKKLDRGTFALPEAPPSRAAHVEVDEATFEALLDGLRNDRSREVRQVALGLLLRLPLAEGG